MHTVLIKKGGRGAGVTVLYDGTPPAILDTIRADLLQSMGKKYGMVSIKRTDINDYTVRYDVRPVIAFYAPISYTIEFLD